MKQINYDDLYKILSEYQLKFNHLDLKESINNLFNESEDSELKNKLWYLKTVFYIKVNFFEIFDFLKSKSKYEEAWNLMEKTQIMINNLKNNPFLCIEAFNIQYIKETLDKFELLFPYYIFSSREMIIKSSKCSICGKEYNVRNFCGHNFGKVYNGHLCQRIIEDAQLICIALVKNPVDKYTFLKIKNEEFNYEAIDILIQNLDSPYEEFKLEKLRLYLKPRMERNALCWCQSGKKYKKCHLDEDINGIHYKILFNKYVEPKELNIINSFKK